MPSQLPLPSALDHLDAYGGAIVGEADNRADLVRGSVYEQPGGAAGILYSREAGRTRDLFRAIYFDTADGSDLTNLVSMRYGINRIMDTFGQGTMEVLRPNASAGAGSFWAGTRVIVRGVSPTPKVLKVSTKTDVQAGATIAHVPLQATVLGPGQGVPQNTPGTFAIIDDPLWDTSWSITSLSCGDGTSFEAAPDLRARVRLQRLQQRRGYEYSMFQACLSAGASHVLLLPSYWGTDITTYTQDFGINACFVADAGFSGSTALVNACKVALEGWRVLGCDLLVAPLAQANLPITVTVSLSDDPGRFDTLSLGDAITGSLINFFAGRSGGFTYTIDALRAACRVASYVQDVTFTTPTADVTLNPGQWPATLTKFVPTATGIQITFTGPS